MEVVAEHSDPDLFLDDVLRRTPNVALVDLTLGTGHGLDVVKSIRRDAPSTQVLVLSGVRQAEIAQLCLESGAAGFLDKQSADARTLAHAVRDVAAGQRIVPFPAFGQAAPASPTSPRVSERLRDLSPRELEVFRMVVLGHDSLKMAAMLGITERTIKAHLSALYRKLSVDNRTQLALLGVRLGLNTPMGE